MYQEKPKDVEEIDSPVLVSSQTVCGYEIVGQFLGVLVACGLSVLPFVAAPLPARRPARLLSVLSETFLPDPRPGHSSHGAEGALSPSFSALSRKINC